MIGVVTAPVWLQTDWLLAQFHPQQSRAREKYMDFVRSRVGLPSEWDGLHNQVFLGGETFIAYMQVKIFPEQLLDEIPRMQWRQLAKPVDSYREEHGDNPRLDMMLAYLSGDYR